MWCDKSCECRTFAPMKITLQRKSDGSGTTAFDASGNPIDLYLPENAGGNATGIRPMQLLILGLAGCSAVDILLILKKQRQQVDDFRIEIEAEREADKEPALWQKAHLIFHFSGKVEATKAQRAIELSMDKYCSVAETLRLAGAVLSWEMRFDA